MARGIWSVMAVDLTGDWRGSMSKPRLEPAKNRLRQNVLAIALANKLARSACSIRWNGSRKFCLT